jgi:hypothetical protein
MISRKRKEKGLDMKLNTNFKKYDRVTGPGILFLRGIKMNVG